MNRVQFQKGESLRAFTARLGSEEACEQALQRARWPNGFRCFCGAMAHGRFRRGTLLMFECRQCGHQTSLVAGTVFEATKLRLTTWFLAAYLLTQTKNNVAALELMRHLGVCYRTAWRMKQKLMQVMTQRESTRTLVGTVLMDDAYLGGERIGGKPGRGSENKQAFVIAVSTNASGHPIHAALEPVASFTKLAIGAFARTHLAPGSEVYTDGLGVFEVLKDDGHAHTTIISPVSRLAAKIPAMKWVNTVLSNVKRSLDGTYHAIKVFKYAHRYLAEAQWRFNRRFDLASMVDRLTRSAANCQPWPETRLRAVPEAH